MSVLSTLMVAGGVLLVTLTVLRKKAAVSRRHTSGTTPRARVPTFTYVFLLAVEGILPSVIVLAVLALSNITAFAPLLHDLSTALALLAHVLT